MTAPKTNQHLSQWLTDPELARRIARWADPVKLRVLEPSAGAGAFVWPLLDLGATVTALDIDPKWTCRLIDEHRGRGGLTVETVDFLEWSPRSRIDLCVMNPPYENGQDTDHLVHALEVADRVVALVRTNIIHGVGRYERIWKHANLRRRINFIDRPRFSGAGSPRHDFCVVDVVKSGSKIGVPLVATEWWYANR